MSKINEKIFHEIEEETSINNIHGLKHMGIKLTNINVPLKSGKQGGLVLSIYACHVNEQTQVKISAEHLSYEWVSPRTAVNRLKDRYPSDLLKGFQTLVA